jgi:hypothetical protein
VKMETMRAGRADEAKAKSAPCRPARPRRIPPAAWRAKAGVPRLADCTRIGGNTLVP